MTDNEGRRFGSRYVLGELVGTGTTGQVFRAVDSESQESVAVKILRPEFGQDDATVTRFVRERTLLKSLEHPNVVDVLDMVVEEAQLGIIMELVSGGSIRERIADSPMTPTESVDMAISIAAGIGAVHDAGITHRDLKPANVLIEDVNGQLTPKIADFGLSRLTDGTQTKLSTVIGTPLYLAPEVANRQGARPAADIYALGIMLFEMLTGETPFTGDDLMQLVTAHLLEPAPGVLDVPPQLSAIVGEMLGKEPSDRPTAAEVERRLAALRSDVNSESVPRIGPRAAGAAFMLGKTPTNESQTLVRVDGSKATPTAEHAETIEPQPAGGPAVPADSRRRAIYAAVAGLGVVLLLAGAFLLRPQSGDDTIESATLTSDSAPETETGADEDEEPASPSVTDSSEVESTTTTTEATTTSSVTTTTAAPVTQPPETQAPVTQPPETQAPVTQPSETQAPVTQPPETQPPETQPPVTQPPVTQPPVTQPVLQGNEIIGLGGQCLEVSNGRSADGQDLWMAPCDGSDAQQWRFQGDRITALGRCLDIEGPSREEEALAQIWTCEDVPQHGWRTTGAGEIISKFSDLCLDVAFSNTAPGATVHMWACNSTPAQRFIFNN